jgi:hypothetical protein
VHRRLINAAPPCPLYDGAMSLQRMWQRQLAEASGVALFVPATILAMVAVLALTGGLGGLGALGQVLSGPAAPPPLAARLVFAVRKPAPLVPGGTATLRPVAGRSAPAALHVAQLPPSGVAPSPGSGSRPATSGGHSTAPAARLPTAPPVPAPSARPAPATSPVSPATPSTPVDALVAAGSGVASQLPGPAGTAVGQVLRSVGSTADGVLASGR